MVLSCLLFLCVTACCFVRTARAGVLEDSSLDLTVTYGEYIWRGFDLLPNDDPAFQPDLYLTLGNTGLYFGAWANFATDKRWEIWDEWDFYFGYTFSVGGDGRLSTELDLGYIYFHFPEQDSDVDSQEVSLGFRFPGLFRESPLSIVPYATVYYSFAAHENETDQEGWWFKLGADFDIPVRLPGGEPDQALNCYLESFLNDGGASSQVDPGWSHTAIGVETTYTVFGIGVTPSFNYQWTWEDTVNEEDEFWFLLKLSRTLF
jgi:uncharacterized protein (TIGR02001 family)